jgi:hypothetical protein
MVPYLLCILNSPLEDCFLVGPRILAQVGLVSIDDILWGDSCSRLLVVLKKLADLGAVQGCPAAFYQVRLPHRQLLMPLHETADEIWPREVVIEPDVITIRYLPSS